MHAPRRSPLHPLISRHAEPLQSLYTERVCVSGAEAERGRSSGIAISHDGTFAAQLRRPLALGGPGGGTNAEQLLAAGYAACFHGALTSLADRCGVALVDASVEAAVSFARDPVDGHFLLLAQIQVRLPSLDRRLAAELIRETERISPCTKLFRRGIEHVVALAPPASSCETHVADP